MNDDQLDRLLHKTGARWRDAQPPAPGVDATSLMGPKRPRWVAPVAAAAAVATVVSGGALLALGGGDRNTDPAPADSPVPDDYVVPWKQLDPTHPKWPAPAARYTPDPALAEGKPWCTTEDLTFERSLEGAGGTMYEFVTIQPAGTISCRLPAQPSVEVTGPDGQALPVPVEVERLDVSGPDGRTWPFDVLVDATHTASLVFSLPSMACDVATPDAHFRVTWGTRDSLAGGITVPGFGKRPSCQGQGDELPGEPVRVYRLAPTDFEVREERHPVADLSVRQVSFSQESEYGPGTAIVALTAKVDTPLTPCPDAQLSMRHSFDDVTQIPYALNCAAVPSRLADGTPYIPAGTALRFEVAVPQWGEVRPTYSWTLSGPVPVTIDLEPDLVEPRVVDDAKDASFVVEVSNQSFDEPVMPIKVYVDDELLVDNAFHVEGQHTWVSYPMLLSPGYHLVRVESADGAEYQDKLVLEEGKVQYALLEYWNEGARGPELTWRTQDQPFLHD